MVALPMTRDPGGSNTAFGIRVLNTSDGSVVRATNGAVIQTLTNIDAANQYTCAAWDNVGNLYGGSTSRNLWRVWSPPGASTNTTVALAQVSVQSPFTITHITSTPTTSGCATVNIAFTAPNLSPSAFALKGSPTVNGLYTAVAGAVISGASNAYTATFTNCSNSYYTLEAYFPGSIQIQNSCFTVNASAFKTYPGYLHGANNPTSITGWTASGNNAGVNGVGVAFTGSPFGPTNSAGYNYGFIQNAGSLSQNLPLPPNTTYTLNFDAAGRKGNNPSFQVQIADASQVYVATGTLVANTGVFTHYSYTFTTPAGIAGMPYIQLKNVTPSGDNTICFSELNLTPATP
jgi:hypothetical protein